MIPTVPIPIQASSDAYYGLALLLLLLAPLAIAGLALVNTGLGRSRSAAQAILGNLVIISVAVIAFALFGAAIAGNLPGTPGGAGHAFHVVGYTWNWIGSGSFLLSSFASAPVPAQLALLFEMAGVAFAAIIPWGSGADRWRLAGGCAASALIAGIVCPLMMHWVWGGGWLAGLGANFSLGAGFLDPGGAASVQVVGGLSALALIWLLGPRAGKYPRTGISTAMPGHNAVYVLFGCLLALVGWLAWNTAGAILWRWLQEPQRSRARCWVSMPTSGPAVSRITRSCAPDRPKMDVVIVRENEEDLYAGIEYQARPEEITAFNSSHVRARKKLSATGSNTRCSTTAKRSPASPRTTS